MDNKRLSPVHGRGKYSGPSSLRQPRMSFRIRHVPAQQGRTPQYLLILPSFANRRNRITRTIWQNSYHFPQKTGCSENSLKSPRIRRLRLLDYAAVKAPTNESLYKSVTDRKSTRLNSSHVALS